MKIVVVDDHHLFRAGVRAELAAHHEVVGEAATPAEALAVIAATQPDVVLLDVHLPDGGGVRVLEALPADGPKVLALSVSDAAEDVVPMIRAGALGYVTKTIDTAELLNAIETVAAGEACFSPRLAAFVLQAFSAPVQAPSELEALTPREREVLHHLARGYAYKRIAQRLGISDRTVETHVGNVLRKLQLSSRHEVSHWAATRGLMDDRLTANGPVREKRGREPGCYLRGGEPAEERGSAGSITSSARASRNLESTFGSSVRTLTSSSGSRDHSDAYSAPKTSTSETA